MKIKVIKKGTTEGKAEQLVPLVDRRLEEHHQVASSASEVKTPTGSDRDEVGVFTLDSRRLPLDRQFSGLPSPRSRAPD